MIRNEDLDAPRVVPGALDAMLADLRWLGLDWDEGPDVGGRFGPYTQSERSERYRAAIDALVAGGFVFPCTCTRRELAASVSAPHGEEPVYPGTCRGGPSHPERPAALRFRLDVPPSFDDLAKGPSAPGLGAGDFVVRRADGVPTYQLAVTVDDRDMAITEVVRGDDLLSSTPKQLALFAALGSEPPRYLHVPLVLGPDGERLGKRHHSEAIGELRTRGVAPSAVVGWLGWSLGLVDRPEPLTAAALIPLGARLDRLRASACRLTEDARPAW